MRRWAIASSIQSFKTLARSNQRQAGMLALVMIGVIACSHSATPAATPSMTLLPTPNVAQTVAAAIGETTEAMPPATSKPTPTSLPVPTIQPTQDLPATIAAAVQIAIAALPTQVPPPEIPTSTPVPTQVPTGTPAPTFTPIPAPTAIPTAIPTATPTAPKSLVSMIKAARPGVVRIEHAGGTGSGVIFDKMDNGRQALILTNYHVVEDDARGNPSNINVTVKDSLNYPATIIGIDEDRDLAVLKICCGGHSRTFTILPFGDARTLGVGSELIAVGYSLGLSGVASTTRGIVSGFRTDTENGNLLIQTDAPINPGNSGGPILNTKGEVVGLNTFKYVGNSIEGLGFAVSEVTLQAQLPRIKEGGDALDAVHGAAQWSFGPGPSSVRIGFSRPAIPWVIEWELEEGGSLLKITEQQTTTKSVNYYNYPASESTISTHTLLESFKPGIGKITNFQSAGRITDRYTLDIEADGQYTVVVKQRSSSSLEPAKNVVAEWNIGQDASTTLGRLNITKKPWVVEWTVEAATTPAEISVAKLFGSSIKKHYRIYDSDWSRLVFATAEQGSGSVQIFETGLFEFEIKGGGQTTVVVKTR